MTINGGNSVFSELVSINEEPPSMGVNAFDVMPDMFGADGSSEGAKKAWETRQRGGGVSAKTTGYENASKSVKAKVAAHPSFRESAKPEGNLAHQQIQEHMDKTAAGKQKRKDDLDNAMAKQAGLQGELDKLEATRSENENYHAERDKIYRKQELANREHRKALKSHNQGY